MIVSKEPYGEYCDYLCIDIGEIKYLDKMMR